MAGPRASAERDALAVTAAARRDGKADVALLCLGTDDLTGLRTADVTEETPFALVPRDHPLARRPTVTVAELRQDANFAPECPPLGLDEILDRVVLGRLVPVVGSGAAERIPSEVAAVPVSDLPPTHLAWPEDARREGCLAVDVAGAGQGRVTGDSAGAGDGSRSPRCRRRRRLRRPADG